MTKLTIAQAIADMVAIGIVLKKTDDGQFRVNFRGGDEATAYYADDLQDAHDTGYAMAEKRAKPVTLTNGEYVRLATWTHSAASVGTLNGMALKPETLAMCRERRDPEAWTVYTGATITTSKAFYERDRARVAGATVIADGDTVEIEGKAYRVRVVPGNGGVSPRNSDPIQFVAI